MGYDAYNLRSPSGDMVFLTEDEVSVIEVFEYNCRAKNLSRQTIKSYVESIRILAKLARSLNKEISQLDKSDIQRFLLYKMNAGDWSGGGANHHIRNWRAFYAFLKNEDLIGYNPASMVSKCKEKRRVKKALTVEQFSQFLKAVDRSTFQGYRDYTMFMLMYDCMLRMGETADIRLSDIHFKPMRQLLIRGKGAKERILSFSHRVAVKLLLYLEQREDIPGDYLFPSRSGTKISQSHVRRKMRDVGNKCGLHVSPHVLRYSGATEFWNETGDAYMAKMILGHSNINTTQKYIHGDTENIMRQYERFSPAVKLHL